MVSLWRKIIGATRGVWTWNDYCEGKTRHAILLLLTQHRRFSENMLSNGELAAENHRCHPTEDHLPPDVVRPLG